MPGGSDSGDFSDRVYQATGMVATQARCNLAAALDRLIEHADRTGKSLEVVAQDVIDRVIRFEP